MGRHRTQNLADPAPRADRANKAAARTTLDTHIRAIAAVADELTPEQSNRLRALIPAPADPTVQTSNLHTVAGMLVALAVIGLTGFIVVRLSGNTPAMAAVLMAFAAVLAAVPSIIKALRGS